MENLLTYSQAAHFLGVPRGTLYTWVYQRRIPHVRLGRRFVRFCPLQLSVWIEAHQVEPGDQPSRLSG